MSDETIGLLALCGVAAIALIGYYSVALVIVWKYRDK